MAINLEAIIYYLFLLDAIMANLTIWFFPGFVKSYKKKFPKLFKHLPLTKPWAFIYLVLVLWIGYALYRLEILFF